MSGLNWQQLRLLLIKGGVAPKFVKRSIDELKMHHEDLKNQALKDGLSENEANLIANNIMGDAQTIVDEVLSRPELKSLVWRYPGLTFSLGPIMTGLIILVISALVIAGWISFRGTDVLNSGPVLIEQILVESIFAFNCFLLTPLLAMLTVIFTKRKTVNPVWPVIGLVLLIVLGTGFVYSIDWPVNGSEGVISANWAYSFLPRVISGNHDLQNYLKIILTLVLCAGIWKIYRPHDPETVASKAAE
jgi:hypothetical protein